MNQVTTECLSDANVEADHNNAKADLTRRAYELVEMYGEYSADRDDYQTEFRLDDDLKITLTLDFDSVLRVLYQSEEVLVAIDKFDPEGDGFIEHHYEPGPDTWESLIEEFYP